MVLDIRMLLTLVLTMQLQYWIVNLYLETILVLLVAIVLMKMEHIRVKIWYFILDKLLVTWFDMAIIVNLRVILDKVNQ